MNEELPEDEPGEEIELGSASPPPEGVEVPVDTPYGSNRPMDPLPAKEPAKAQNPTEPPTASAGASSANSVKIPIVFFLVILMGLLGAAFYAGKQTAPQGQASPDKQNTDPKGNPSGERPRKKRANFFQDSGIYARTGGESCWDLLPARLEMAKNQIFVVTGYPGNPHLLEALGSKKADTGLPIYILTGSDTPEREMMTAKAAGFQVYRLQAELERPYGVVIVDGKLIFDISREFWGWETTEPEVVKATGDWAASLLEGAELK